jgi:hypothetical protein
MAFKTTRHCEGSYTVTDGNRKVSVVRVDEWAGPDKWQARADWDNYTYTDPLPTKRAAVSIAHDMLREKGLQDGGVGHGQA